MFLDPGFGKTSITYATIKILKKRGLFTKALVVAPLKPCYLVWPKEAKKWEDFKDIKVVILHGPNKEEALKEEADVYVINPEGLDWLLSPVKTKTKNGKVSVSVDVKRFKKFGFDMLVLDELSKYKNTSSQRFKMMKQVIGTFGRRLGLTGSPAANGLEGLFGQCYMLDEGRTFGKYITGFRSKYFDQSHDGFGYTLKPGADEQIYKAIKPLVIRGTAEDYYDMPEIVYNNIVVELPKNVMKIYKSIENDLIAKIDEGLVVAATSGAATVKCRQVANGGVYMTPDIEDLIKSTGREWTNLHTEKIDALCDLLDELQGSPILIAYEFEHDMDRIRERFGDVPYIGKGVSPKRQVQIEKDWNAGKIPYLFGHPQSMGHGLNLQEAGNHVCWHSMIYDYELYDQFNRRVRRQGNTSKRVFCHHILAEDTIDFTILSALQGKERGQNAFFKALKKLKK